MWPLGKKVRTIRFDGPLRGIREPVSAKTIREASRLLCYELEKRLDTNYDSPFEQQRALRDINDITWGLIELAKHYDSAPEFFQCKNIIPIYRLMRRAAEYSKGTDYQIRIMDGPRDFLETLLIEKRCARSMARIPQLRYQNDAA